MNPKLSGFTYNSLNEFYKNFIDLGLSYICCFFDPSVGPNRGSTLFQKRGELDKLAEDYVERNYYSVIEKHQWNVKFELKDLRKIIGEGDQSADPQVWWIHSLQEKSSLWQQYLCLPKRLKTKVTVSSSCGSIFCHDGCQLPARPHA